VAKSAAASDQRLDEVYREHPGEFVSRRNELAKELQAAGDRDEAARVKKLRRPTAAAWLINLAAHSSPAELQEFAEASRELEQAQERALEGEDEGAEKWRAAAEREREATTAVADRAARLARDVGHPPSPRAVEQAVETLRAAAADPELRERVVRGRVERERTAATIGTPAAGPPPKRARGAARRRATAQARRDLERLEEDLADASAREERLRERVERATEALREEKVRLAESKRETTGLRRKLKSAQRKRRDSR
jgi:hypothetical protein